MTSLASRPTVAVVGAGIAGAACARALLAADVAVEVLDRGRAPGGRLSSRTVDGRPVDLGASYCTARDERFVAVVDDWLARGLARPWTDAFHVAGPDGLGARKQGPLRYGAPAGLRSLVEDLLTGTPLRSSTTVTAVGPGPTVDARAYDAVVLALPDPQAARLLSDDLTAEVAAVAGRTWEPVLALAAGWDERHWDPSFDGCFVDGSPVGGSPVGGGDVLGWIADDGRRRGDGAPVLVAHSTSSFAAAHLEDPEAATQAMVEATSAVLGVAPPPAWSLVQRWTYARPAGPRDAPFHLGPARVGLCGDGWGSPKVETAYLSGRLLGERLAEELTGRSAGS
jgi:predicted NAD/FAD-dependent oxidoreductase